jgi:hypothetical protein
MAQGRKVLAASLLKIDASDSRELASSPDLSEACMLRMRVGGLPPLGCPGAAAGRPP